MHKRFLLTISLILAGCVLMGLGVLRGETLVILQKATTICLECIGIG